MTQRTDRIDELLRQEIGKALEREVTDPRIGFVTVTKVETVPDLSRAKVWVSIIGTADERKLTLRALSSAMPFIRHGLSSKIRLRRIPEFDVKLDDTIERGTRVLQILNDLSAGQDPDAGSGPGESLPTPVPRVRHDGDTEEETHLGEAAQDHAAQDRARASRPRASRRNERGSGPARGAAGKSGDRRRPR